MNFNNKNTDVKSVVENHWTSKDFLIEKLSLRSYEYEINSHTVDDSGTFCIAEVYLAEKGEIVRYLYGALSFVDLHTLVDQYEKSILKCQFINYINLFEATYNVVEQGTAKVPEMNFFDFTTLLEPNFEIISGENLHRKLKVVDVT